MDNFALQNYQSYFSMFLKFGDGKIVSDEAKDPPAYRGVRQGAFNKVSNDFNEPLFASYLSRKLSILPRRWQ